MKKLSSLKTLPRSSPLKSALILGALNFSLITNAQQVPPKAGAQATTTPAASAKTGAQPSTSSLSATQKSARAVAANAPRTAATAVVGAGTLTPQNTQQLFMESQLKYESDLRNQISDTLGRLLGPQKFYSVSVNVKLEKISPLAQLEQNNLADDLDSTGLVYTPLPSQFSSANPQEDANYRIQSVLVDLAVDAKLSPTQQRSVLDLVKNSLTGLPARVNLRAIESMVDDPAAALAKEREENNRKIASEEAAKDAAKSPLERYQLLIFVSGLIIATLILGLMTKQGLGLLASGITSLGESLNTKNTSKLEVDGELDGKGAGVGANSGDGKRDGTQDDIPEGVNKPLLSISMRYFERNRTIFLQYLEEKPHLIYGLLSKEPDSNIRFLRVLGPYMSPRNREQIRKLLGGRTELITDEKASYDTIRALDWLNVSVEKICTSEIGEDVTLASKLENDDLFALSSMKEKDFEELAGEIPSNDKTAWNVFAQILPKQSIRALYEKVPLEQWANLFNVVQSNSNEEKVIAKKLIDRARQKQASRRMGSEAQDKLFSKLIPELVAHLSGQVIHEELQKWSAVYSRVPGLRERISDRYWTLEKLEFVPDKVIADWSKGFTTSVLSALLYYIELSGQDRLLGRVLAALPESTRKTIVISGYTKLKNKEPSRSQMMSDAVVIRRALEGLRAAYIKGQFQLSGSSSGDSNIDLRKVA